MYDLMEAIGAHEIVIEDRDHQQNLATLDSKQIENVLLAYQERLLDLEGDHRFQQFLIIKNYPGVFNRHPHSHLLALPVIPKRIDEEILGVLDYFQRKERCIYCDMIREEVSGRKRVVFETAHFLVFSPFASRFPSRHGSFPRSTLLIFIRSIRRRGAISPGQSSPCYAVSIDCFPILRIA